MSVPPFVHTWPFGLCVSHGACRVVCVVPLTTAARKTSVSFDNFPTLKKAPLLSGLGKQNSLAERCATLPRGTVSQPAPLVHGRSVCCVCWCVCGAALFLSRAWFNL